MKVFHPWFRFLRSFVPLCGNSFGCGVAAANSCPFVVKTVGSGPKCDCDNNVTFGCDLKITRKPNIHAGCDRVTLKRLLAGEEAEDKAKC